ncbi:MAG: hypothetical protein KAS72_13445 [Phycisphaerales bacterium]|nr:hypothetical protein [Phycisphaerales bacterium]
MTHDSTFSTIHGCAIMLAAALCCGMTHPAAAQEVTDAHTAAQTLRVHLDPEAGTINGAAEIQLPADLADAGSIRFDLHRNLKVVAVQVVQLGRSSTAVSDLAGEPVDDSDLVLRYTVPIESAATTLVIAYRGRLVDDVEAGEVAGQVHNHSVRSHISSAGVFLSEASCWYPWLLGSDDDADMKSSYDVMIAPIDGWAFVVSGDPVGDDGDAVGPSLRWRTPRSMDGVALVGGQHVVYGDRSTTGVEIAVHTAADKAELAPMFAAATKEYLAIYEPLLGPYPYKRFSIVENFFSSGFAFPGFTLLDGRVLSMGPRALMPGMLDHEMVHNWWGNGVYVSSADGNWCEALTSHNTNMSRYGLQGEEDRSQAYRRGNLMKLAADPTLDPDDGAALDRFSRAGDPGRYVGYDKGSMVMHMVRRRMGDDAYWEGLRRLAEDFMGRDATWDDIFASLDPDDKHGLDALKDQFVRRGGAPKLVIEAAEAMDGAVTVTMNAGKRAWRLDVPIRLYGADGTMRDVTISLDGQRTTARIETDQPITHVEIDPDFHVYRLLPSDQVIATITNTLAGALRFVTTEHDSRDEVASFTARFDDASVGEGDDGVSNLFVLGLEGARSCETPLTGATNPIHIAEGRFEVGGSVYDKPGQAVMHTCADPDHPGRYITVFHSNGDAGWAKLRLVTHYSRDTTIVWEDGRVIERIVHEPDRRVAVTSNE